MKSPILIFILLVVFKLAVAADEPLDMDLLEWLGETAEAEELGVDIENLLQSQEDSEQKTEENSQ